jgi:hypothetical protein
LTITSITAAYRGVRLDVAAVKEGGPQVLLAADIPLSAVADTLLIPVYARRAALARPASDENPAARADLPAPSDEQTGEFRGNQSSRFSGKP